MKQAVQVTILGQHYTVRSEAPAEEVHKVAEFVNRQIDEVAAGGRVVDSLSTVVLALLNVAGAYVGIRDELPGPEIEARLRSLLNRIESACPEGLPD